MFYWGQIIGIRFYQKCIGKIKPEHTDFSPFWFLHWQFKNPGDEQVVPLPTYSYCKQISTQEFDKQKVSTSQAAIEELLENIIRSKNLPPKEKRKKLKQVQECTIHLTNVF